MNVKIEVIIFVVEELNKPLYVFSSSCGKKLLIDICGCFVSGWVSAQVTSSIHDIPAISKEVETKRCGSDKWEI